MAGKSKGIHIPFHECLHEPEASIDCIKQYVFEIQFVFAMPNHDSNQKYNDCIFRLAKLPYVLYQTILDAFSFLIFHEANWHNEKVHLDFHTGPKLQSYFSTTLWFLC